MPRGFFDAGKNPYNDNQFGGSIGGRVIKDKLFVFTDYQGERLRQAVTVSDVIPSLAQRNGRFLRAAARNRHLRSGESPAVPRQHHSASRFDQPSALDVLPAARA